MYCRWKLGLPNEGAEKKIVPLPRIGTVEFIPGEVVEVGGFVYDLVKNMYQLEWLDDNHEAVKDFLEKKNPKPAEPVAENAPESEDKNKKSKNKKEE